jgi:CheY-like chemotaxis protein
MMENKNTNIPDSQTKGKKTILIVDDSDTIRLFIRSLLEKDYEIIDKNDGQDALTYLSQGNHPDLILLDMEMPNMNGRVFVRRVNSDPRHGKIPIVFITAVNSSLIINSFKNMGVVDFIIKPFKPEELVAKVNDIFFLKN